MKKSQDNEAAGAATARGPLRLVFWESTSRCNLRCAHCRRLEADEAAGDELSTTEAQRLIDSVAELGRPIFVFSGGEPLLREDWQALAEHARDKGLPTALATNGTLIDAGLAGRIAAAGFHRVAVSLDAADAERHDTFRGVRGAFKAAVRGIGCLRKAGVAVQINSTIFAGNVDQLDRIHRLAGRLGAAALHLFVLVPVGCGLQLAEREQLSPTQCEDLLGWVCRRQAEGAIEIKATCAPQYHRVASCWLKENAEAPGAERVRAALRGRGCLAGIAVAFVSHSGEVFPCGYLPLSCGSVRRRALAEIWVVSPVLAELRNFDLLAGNCGRCEYKSACGGCRARAFAATGEWTAADPMCAYRPQAR